MSKPNIRSFRYSDEVAQILMGFQGNSMNEKFENLVLYCHKQVPFVEKRLHVLNDEIENSYEKLKTVSLQCREIDMLVGNLNDIKNKIKCAGDCADLVLEKLK